MGNRKIIQILFRCFMRYLFLRQYKKLQSSIYHVLNTTYGITEVSTLPAVAITPRLPLRLKPELFADRLVKKTLRFTLGTQYVYYSSFPLQKKNAEIS